MAIRKSVAVLLSAYFICTTSAAEEPAVLKTDRYTLIKLSPSHALIEPLTAIAQIKFPGQVLTVEEAMNYVLDESGFALVGEAQWTPEMRIMLKSALPVVQRDFTQSPMSINSVLEVLAGPAFKVVQDPLRRLVSFELKTEYRGLIDG